MPGFSLARGGGRLMKLYNDNEIAGLIYCPKIIVEPPARQMKAERGSYRNGMLLRSKDGDSQFRVFIRQSVDFEEDFSVGLDYLSRDDSGSVCLTRYNGKHGGHEAHPHHLNCHIHIARAVDINAGIRMEKHITPTIEYASFYDAIRCFMKDVQVEGIERYFDFINQDTIYDVFMNNRQV